MSKSKLQMPVPLLKTLDELEETTNDHNNNLSRNLEANKLNPDAKNKQKQSSIASTARSSSSITTISNTTNIKTKLKSPAANQSKKSSASSRKKSISDTSVDESVSEQSVQLVSLPRQGLDYEKLVPSQCDCDLLKLSYINSYEKYLIQRIFSSVGKLSSYMSDLSSVSLKHYLNTPDQNEFLPLYYAIKANNLTAVKYLVSTGASLIKTTSHGDPAAHLACLVGCSSDLVDFLLECLDLDKMCANFDNLNNKENKSSLYRRDQEGWTVLHCACNQGNINIVKHLIEKKFMNINVKDTKKNYTGLHLAVVNNRVEVVDYLISFEPMSSIKKCNNETIFNTNIKRPVKSALPEQKKVTDIPIEVQLSKRRSSSALSISQNSDKINRRLSTDSRRKSNQSMSNHLKVPGSGSNLRRISSEVIHEEAKDISIKIENNLPKPKPMRPRTAYEPITFYSVTEVFKTEPIKFYNNQIIDINSVNNDGQNALHLACKYGRYDIVNILLRKFGSNSLDLNMVDFKGKTSFDLAWNWLININNSQESNINKDSIKKHSIHSFQEKLLNLNTHLENEIQLMGLLNQYGAKFSSYETLFHDYTELTLDLNNLISNYLKCVLYLFKLNLPTLFLNSNNANSKKLNLNINLKDNVTSLSSLSGSGTGSAMSSYVISSSSNSVLSFTSLKQTTETFVSCFKRDMKQNLNDLNRFIQFKFDQSSLEARLFSENIQIALDYLSRF